MVAVLKSGVGVVVVAVSLTDELTGVVAVFVYAVVVVAALVFVSVVVVVTVLETGVVGLQCSRQAMWRTTGAIESSSSHDCAPSCSPTISPARNPFSPHFELGL